MFNKTMRRYSLEFEEHVMRCLLDIL